MSTTSDLAAHAAIVSQALLSITIGSFGALKTPPDVSARLSRKRKSQLRLLGLDDDEDDDDEEECMTFEVSDAIELPIIQSVALFGIFLAIKYFDPKWISLVFQAYTCFAGMWASHLTLSLAAGLALRVFNVTVPTYHIRVSKGIKQVFHLPMKAHSLFLVPVSIALPIAYLVLGKPYILGNTLALCLGTALLALLKLDGFKTAFLLLGLLLIYDVFWVFYTPVMITVVQNIDAPIKLLASRDVAGKSKFMMLGLGDIVIPGLVVAVCLQFDLARASAKQPAKDITRHSSFAKPYFYTALIAYILGLVAAFVAVQKTNSGQPALLYLSPACTFAPVLLALVRGELGVLWSWNHTAAKEENSERDDTIEPGSEIAARNRAEARQNDRGQGAAATSDSDKQQEQPLTNGSSPPQENLKPVADSSVNSTLTAPESPPATEARSRKRKAGKRK